MRLDLTLLPPMKGWCADSLQNTRDFDGAKCTVSRDKGKPQQFHSAPKDAWVPGLALPAKQCQGVRRSSHFTPWECSSPGLQLPSL